jgi:hypothetical protein
MLQSQSNNDLKGTAKLYDKNNVIAQLCVQAGEIYMGARYFTQKVEFPLNRVWTLIG